MKRTLITPRGIEEVSVTGSTTEESPVDGSMYSPVKASAFALTVTFRLSLNFSAVLTSVVGQAPTQYNALISAFPLPLHSAPLQHTNCDLVLAPTQHEQNPSPAAVVSLHPGPLPWVWSSHGVCGPLLFSCISASPVFDAKKNGTGRERFKSQARADGVRVDGVSVAFLGYTCPVARVH